MNELTLKIEELRFLYEIDKELKEYLISLEGVLESEFNSSLNEIYVKYDASLINLEILKFEILAFLSLLKIPSIIGFNNKVINHSIIIKDLCCEYCLMIMIEELLSIKGIESALTNFDYHNKKDVIITIQYDNKLINEKEIKKIEKEFNS